MPRRRTRATGAVWGALALAACTPPGTAQLDPKDTDAAVPDTDGVDSDGPADTDGVDAPSGWTWNDFVGAHYTPRDWARGGLRDPGGAGSNGFRPTISGTTLTDDRLVLFETRTLPVVAEILAAGGYLVLQVAGGESFYDAMELPGGRAAFAQALHDRLDAIAGLPDAGDWPSHVVFQFGNEIQNPERFYGELCAHVTDGATTTCDFATAFAPAYIDLLLAPGAEILRAESEARFGRPDALRVGLGSVVSLVARRDFVEGLLTQRVGGTLAPTLVGQPASAFVDTVTIHYTMTSAQAPAVLDDFFATWTAPSASSSIRALWMTEEVGVRAAASGDGLSTFLRAFVPAWRWWRSRGLSPELAHLFVWGAEVDCDAGAEPGCLSIDAAMPWFHDAVGDRELVEDAAATATATDAVEVTSYAAGPDRRVVLVWGPATGAADPVDVTGVTVDAAAWTGRTITADVRIVGSAGLVPVAAETAGSAQVALAFDAPLTGKDVLVVVLHAD